MPIPSLDLHDRLAGHGFRFFTGVPCSYLKHLINQVLADPKARYVPAANEGTALGIAAGAAEAGQRPVVMIQNSGFGNLINPLTSLSLIYRIPTLLMISMRAFQFPDGELDEPQHRIVGSKLTGMLDQLDVPYAVMPDDPAALTDVLANAATVVDQGGVFALLVVRNAIKGPSKAPEPAAAAYPLSRVEAIRMVAEHLGEDDAVVATTGMVGRELFGVADRPGNFYMQGSMGHALPIGLGVALAGRPDRRVVVLDGDGSAIMHLGTMSTVGAFAPPNLLHVVLDNEAYATTGNQITTSTTTRLDGVAEACGYRWSAFCRDAAEFSAALERAGQGGGPGCIVVKINHETMEKTPRVTTRYEPDETAAIFASFLKEG